MKRLAIPLLIAAVVAGGLMMLNWLGPDPVQALVTERRILDEFGVTRTLVEWDGGSAFVVVAEGTEPGETVSVIVPESGDPYVGKHVISPPVVIIGTFVGLLLGFVVDYSLQGYGYVRGRGGVSETPDLDVAEDRGFYWRT